MKRFVLIVVLVFSCVLAFAAVGNAANIGLKGIGGRVGLVMPEGGADNTLGFGVVADLGTVTSQLRLEGFADYWGDSWGIAPYECSWSTVTIGGTVKYDFPIEAAITPFVGGGAGFAISRSECDTPVITGLYGTTAGGGSVSSSDTDISFHLVGGIDMPVGTNMKFTAQAKYVMDVGDVLWLTVALLFQL